ncbi:MAG: virB8 family protein [Halocynthiibacter sp.]
MKQAAIPVVSKSERSILEAEMIFGVRKRERLAWSVAFLGLAVGLFSAASIGVLLPLKETRAYLAIVDKDTGIAERAVEVRNASIEHSAAIEQSLIFSYVTDREVFDVNDNEARVLSVYERSNGQAAATLKAQWDNSSPTYPPTLYGSGARAEVTILSINPISENTAQVRFTKTLTSIGEPDRTGKFYATVTYEFFPSTGKKLQLVWTNPFGFTVTSYRVTSQVQGQ